MMSMADMMAVLLPFLIRRSYMGRWGVAVWGVTGAGSAKAMPWDPANTMQAIVPASSAFLIGFMSVHLLVELGHALFFLSYYAPDLEKHTCIFKDAGPSALAVIFGLVSQRASPGN
ncbi:hypothetical protein CPT76_17265 [Paenibacillus sp. AR247]|nr:hypothetical protein CPT76_17265 [Paenibacillus sp. AR247]